MDIAIPVGLSRGASPSDRPGRWYDGNLIRSVGPRIQPIGGWVRITSTPLASPVRRLHVAVDNGDIKRYAVGCDDRILIYEGSVITDVSPDGLVPLTQASTLAGGFGDGAYGRGTWGTPRPSRSPTLSRTAVWSIASWGQDILAVDSEDGRLLQWTPSAPTAAMTTVSGAPVGNRGMVVTDERSVMVICPETERRRVAWSSHEQLNDWSFADVTSTAGFLDLETNGQLCAIVKCRDGMIVWSDSGDVFLIRDVGSQYVYGVTKIGTGTPLLSPNSMVVSGGQVYWMSQNGFYLYESGIVKPVACEIGDLFVGMNSTWATLRAHGSINGLFAEAWWFYPSANSRECDRYVMLDTVTGAWWTGALPRTAMHPSGVTPGPLMAGTDQHLYVHERGWLASGLLRTGQVWVESNIMPNDGQVAVLRAQMDSGAGSDRTQLEIIGSQTREGPEVTYGPYRTGPDGWMPTRAGGRHLRIRITEIGDGGDWSIGKLAFDAQPVGNR